MKTSISILKNNIKKLAEEQKFLKNQRKTENLKGERIIEPKVATYKHINNRETLRIMYAAYGLMRGKTFSQIEKHSEENHPLNKFKNKIDSIILEYNLYVEK